jgi:hypothetical protein
VGDTGVGIASGDDGIRQLAVARTMQRLADAFDVRFVVTLGDTIYHGPGGPTDHSGAHDDDWWLTGLDICSDTKLTAKTTSMSANERSKIGGRGGRSLSAKLPPTLTSAAGVVPRTRTGLLVLQLPARHSFGDDREERRDRRRRAEGFVGGVEHDLDPLGIHAVAVTAPKPSEGVRSSVGQ